MLLGMLFCSSLSLVAQNKDGAVTIPDTLDHSYVRITGVVITGNKLTKERIITRELDFRIGDSLATSRRDKARAFSEKRFYTKDSSELLLRMQYSRENIINTKLFLRVDLSLEQVEGNSYKLHIDVNERNYFWIFPVVKLNAPNFNEWLRDIDLSELSMGLFTSHNNLWGLSHQASLIGYVGPSWAIAFGYYIPWIGKGQKTGLRMGFGYENLAVAEYGSLENKRQMLYENGSISDYKLNATLTLRPGLYNYGTVKLSAQHITISDTMFSLDSNFLAGHKKTNQSVSLYADYYYDSRNSHSYPLKGSLLRVFVDKRGLGILSKDVDLFFYGIDFHFYQKIGKKFYVAEMFKVVSSSGQNYPYYYQQSITGKKDFIRGFDLYTIKGDQILYSRNNIKYELVKPSIKKAKPGQENNKFKNIQYAFYLNAFADAGYVDNKFTVDNPMNNKMLFSWGLGIDFVTYYDLVLRFEYAFTSEGTNGFFIAFGMPI
jgi:outer membrane protein assembly factor BamA